MRRRYFDHVYSEICVAAHRRVSRYDLWLAISENGSDPNALTPPQIRGFVKNGLTALLTRQGVCLGLRAQHRLERSILRFDPDHPTPEEWMMSLFASDEEAA